MKDSKTYSERVHRFYRSVKPGHARVEKPEHGDIVAAMVYGIISEKLTEHKARAVVRRFESHFVDYNDLRVSRPDEIIAIIGEDSAAAQQTASSLLEALRAIFEKYNTLSLEVLRKMGKRPARSLLAQLQGMSQFAIDYCMLTALGSHAIPLTETMIKYLRDNELVHPQADEQDIEGFLVRQISADKVYEFYALLRWASESSERAVTRCKAGKEKKKTRVKS